MKRFLLMILVYNFLFVSTVFAMVQTGTQTSESLKLEYPLVYLESQSAQMAINTDIASYVDQFKTSYSKGAFYEGKMTYVVKYEDNQYLSLVLTAYFYYAGAAHGHYYDYGLVYNKDTGERIPISHFINVAKADQVHYGILDNVLIIENEWGKPIKEKFTASQKRVKRISDDYYLGGNGIIKLIYQPYELSSYSDGATRILFTPKAIDFFNRQNS